jgi:hypothetical protein
MKTHTGACHCRKITYTVDLDLSQPVIECNCSHCAVQGALLQFTPLSSFEQTGGEAETKEYRFNKHVIGHYFCSECGIEPFGKGKDKDGSDTVAINVRTIDDVDLAALTRMPWDGKSQ